MSTSHDSSAPAHPSRAITIGDPAWGVEVGGRSVALIAGPCAVESAEMLDTVADGVIAAGACALRGGAFKPRTSPYSYQGSGAQGLEVLARARARLRTPVVTEALDVRHVGAVADVADVIQIGTRNMANVPLLREAGATGLPVLLKRGFSATIEEWLHAADYVIEGGSDRVILCERGIRTFETATRFTLDVSAVPVLRERTDLPVVVDPSHAAGDARYVAALARAAVAAGADGVMVEVHPDPSTARSDGAQSLTIERFAALAEELDRLIEALGKTRAAGGAISAGGAS